MEISPKELGRGVDEVFKSIHVENVVKVFWSNMYCPKYKENEAYVEW